MPRKEVGQRSSITFLFVFGTPSVTFWSLLLTLLSLFRHVFCQTPFAGLLLRQGDSVKVASQESTMVSSLWLHRVELLVGVRHSWLCSLPGDSRARPASYHGQGEWLQTMAGRNSHSWTQCSAGDGDTGSRMPGPWAENNAAGPRGASRFTHILNSRCTRILDIHGRLSEKRVRNCAPKRVRNCITFGEFLDPLRWYRKQLSCGTVSNFHFASGCCRNAIFEQRWYSS